MRLYNSHKLDNHLQLSLMDTHQSPEETPRCLQHNSPPPHCGRPLVRLRHERINTHPHQTTTSNDNNLQATPKCIRTHLPYATRCHGLSVYAVCVCNRVRLPGTGQSAHVIGGSRFTRPASNSRRTLLN